MNQHIMKVAEILHSTVITSEVTQVILNSQNSESCPWKGSSSNLQIKSKSLVQRKELAEYCSTFLFMPLRRAKRQAPASSELTSPPLTSHRTGTMRLCHYDHSFYMQRSYAGQWLMIVISSIWDSHFCLRRSQPQAYKPLFTIIIRKVKKTQRID